MSANVSKRLLFAPWTFRYWPLRILFSLLLYGAGTAAVAVAGPSISPLALSIVLLAFFVVAVGLYKGENGIESRIAALIDELRSQLVVGKVVIAIERERLSHPASYVRSGKQAFDLLRAAYPNEMAGFLHLAREQRVVFIIDEQERAACILVAAALKEFGFAVQQADEQEVPFQALNLVLGGHLILTLRADTSQRVLAKVLESTGLENFPNVFSVDLWLENPHNAYVALKGTIPSTQAGFETAFLGVILSVVAPLVQRGGWEATFRARIVNESFLKRPEAKREGQ